MRTRFFMPALALPVLIFCSPAGAQPVRTDAFSMHYGELINRQMESPLRFQSQLPASDNVIKSPVKAFFLSLLIPGLGERYVGTDRLVRYLIGAEAGLWGIYAGHRLFAGWLEDEYKSFAAGHAGAESRGKSDRYFVDIGNFDTLYQFNEKKRIDRALELTYAETGEFFWDWDSETNRLRFREKRIRSDDVSNRAVLWATLIFFNHVVSGVNAALAARTINQRDGRLSWNLYSDSGGGRSREEYRLGVRWIFRWQ